MAVAPYTGAWIETGSFCGKRITGRSLLIRERGLKPFLENAIAIFLRRSLYGSVD